MDLKKKLSRFFITTSTSFSVIMLLYTALVEPLDAELSVAAVWKLFATCAMVSLVIFITDFFFVSDNKMMYLVISFLEVFLTVFLFGGKLLGLFTFNWQMFLVVLGMLSLAYAGVVVVILIGEQMTADDINQKITQMKKHYGEEK